MVADLDSVVGCAVAQTGLADFGDDSFAKAWKSCCRRCATRRGSTSAAKPSSSAHRQRHLSQRLQVEDWYRRHPEIDDVAIAAPLIGLGLPRTGSTALSMLLAQDPDVRYLRRWESSQPCPPPSTVQGVDPRIPADKGEMVGTRDHVPGDTHGPMECHELMALDFKSHIFQVVCANPLVFDVVGRRGRPHPDLRLSAPGDEAAELGEPQRPWRLKCPSHVLWLDALNTRRSPTRGS